mmetsp:Transcript_27373/g.41433  ORF Transcript_27373/g.41433 Transcript_27373/m.41433 type:complete len:82 (+) Transcript_27373:232-477(+)
MVYLAIQRLNSPYKKHIVAGVSEAYLFLTDWVAWIWIFVGFFHNWVHKGEPWRCLSFLRWWFLISSLFWIGLVEGIHGVED